MKQRKLARKIIALILMVICTMLTARAAYAGTMYSAPDLQGCKNVCVDSNSTGAYLYGFSGSTLFSSMLLPSRYNRSLTAANPIKYAVQCGCITYALYSIDNKTDKYGIVGLNMIDGSTKAYEFSGITNLFKYYFTISGDCIYFIRTDDTYSYVAAYSLSGTFLKKFSFQGNVYSLFNNNSSSYAMLYDGSIYKLSGTSATCVNKLNRAEDCINAGSGRICTQSGCLVSLTDNTSESVRYFTENCVVCDSQGIYSKSGSNAVYQPKSGGYLYCNVGDFSYLLIYDGKTIIVTEDFNYRYISQKEYKSNTNTIATTAGISNSVVDSTISIPDEYSVINGEYLCGVVSGTTVSRLKNKFAQDVSVTSSNGSLVTSGNIRTGYKLVCGENTYTLVVTGDVTGEGNVKSNDITAIMNYFTEGQSFDTAQKLATDYNMDGNTDNKDLVLIARAVN